MTEWNDMSLLRRYVDHRSEEAFSTLVARHIHKVYSSALRQTQNPAQAEEVSQVTFVILARKAEKLPENTILTAWLFKTVRLTALTLRRSEQRRHSRETEAFMQLQPESSARADWDEIQPTIDAALSELTENDRAAILLRYMDGKTVGQVASALTVSEDAAKKRIHRALEKLRALLVARGVPVTLERLASALALAPLDAAPREIVESVLAAALAGGTSTLTSIPLLKGTLKLMAWTKTKIAVTTAVILGVATVGTTIGVRSLVSHLHQPLARDTRGTKRIITDGLNRAHNVSNPLYVYASGDEATRRHLMGILARFRKGFRPQDILRSDTEVTEEELKSRTVYLYGAANSHRILRRFRDQLPIRFDDTGLTAGQRRFSGADVGAIFFCPNPLNPELDMIVYGTVAPAALREMNNVFHGPTDFVIFNDTTRQMAGNEVPEDICHLLSGAFDQTDAEHWKVSEDMLNELPVRLQKVADATMAQATAP